MSRKEPLSQKEPFLENVANQSAAPEKPSLTSAEITETRGEAESGRVESGAEVGETARLQQQLEEKRQELEEMRQQYLRLAADFENFRRRTRQEIEEIRSFGAEQLLWELLPVLDNFERALVSARAVLPENVVTGIDMIYRQFLAVLNHAGLRCIEAVGKSFDPVYHEAFEQVETGEWPEGTAVDEVQKGYLLHGKVLRPALVRVAKKDAVTENQEDNTEILEKEEGKDE